MGINIIINLLRYIRSVVLFLLLLRRLINLKNDYTQLRNNAHSARNSNFLLGLLRDIL
jgi:hypothetical protein